MCKTEILAVLYCTTNRVPDVQMHRNGVVGTLVEWTYVTTIKPIYTYNRLIEEHSNSTTIIIKDSSVFFLLSNQHSNLPGYLIQNQSSTNAKSTCLPSFHRKGHSGDKICF